MVVSLQAVVAVFAVVAVAIVIVPIVVVVVGTKIFVCVVCFFLRTAPSAHILPLRRFIENVVDSDLRSFFASSCFKVSCGNALNVQRVEIIFSLNVNLVYLMTSLDCLLDRTLL